MLSFSDDYSIEFLEIQDCFPNPEALCYPLTPQDKDDLNWMEMSETGKHILGISFLSFAVRSYTWIIWYR